LRIVRTEGDEQAVQTPASQPEPAPPKNRAGGQAGASNSSSLSSSQTICKAPSEVRIRWQKFMAEARPILPKEMRYGDPAPEDCETVLKRLDEIPENKLNGISRVQYLVDEVEEWVEYRGQRVIDLYSHRWRWWLRESIWPCW
jgi:hypothetical protein